MIIHVEDLSFQTIIGILDFERENPQEVVVNLTLEYNYNRDYIDYVEIVSTIKTMMQKNKYLLLEDAILDISKQLKENFSNILWIDLKIAKPSILADCTVSLSLKS